MASLALLHPAVPAASRLLSAARFALLVLVGNMAFYTANSLFLGPLVAFIDAPVPEGRRIAADVSFVSQAGNVLLLLYVTVPHGWAPPPPRRSMLLLACLAVGCPIALALGWRETVHGHSLVILGMGALAGSLGVLCNLVGWAWAERFGPRLLPGLAAGMAAAALVPSTISLVMNPGPKQRFGVDVFFFIAAGMAALGGVAVVVLEWVPPFAVPGPTTSSRRQRRTLKGTHTSTSSADGSSGEGEGKRDDSHSADDSVPLLQVQAGSGVEAELSDLVLARAHCFGWRLPLTPRVEFAVRMATLAWIASIIFGWQPGLLPYLLPSSRIVGFQLAGQFTLAVVCTLCFLSQLSLAGAADQHAGWYAPTQAVINGVFSLTYGAASTRFVMSASSFTRALAKPDLTLDENRQVLMQRMGACISLGIGAAGILVYFVVHYGLDRHG